MQLSALLSSIGSAPYAGPDACIDQLAHHLCHGSLRVAKASHLTTGSVARFKRVNGRASVSILPAELAASSAGIAKRFASAAKARLYIDSLQMSDAQAQQLVAELKLPAPANMETKEVLAQGLAEGRLSAQEALGRVGKTEKTSSAPQSAQNTPGNRRVEQVTPAANPSAPAAAAPNMEAAANDQQDQARALVEASENGDPFCEECQKRQASA